MQRLDIIKIHLLESFTLYHGINLILQCRASQSRLPSWEAWLHDVTKIHDAIAFYTIIMAHGNLPLLPRQGF